MGLKEGTFTDESWLPITTVLTNPISSRECGRLSAPTSFYYHS